MQEIEEKDQIDVRRCSTKHVDDWFVHHMGQNWDLEGCQITSELGYHGTRSLTLMMGERVRRRLGRYSIMLNIC